MLKYNFLLVDYIMSLLKRVFVPVWLAGLLMSRGVPGLEDTVILIWNNVSKILLPLIPEEFKWQFALLSVFLVLMVIFAKIEPVIEAIGYGGLGIVTLFGGFFGGLLIVTPLQPLGIILTFVGAISAALADNSELYPSYY